MAPQTWDPEHYAKSAGFVSELGVGVVDLLAPKAGERILDLGCGEGTLAERIAATGASVTGIDQSPEQIAAAAARGLDVRVMDAASMDFDGEFDAVFSNAALHWVRPPEAVAAGVFRALKPGGRFVGEMGGKGNVACLEGAMEKALERRGVDPAKVNPWYFPDVSEYRSLLEGAGFRVDSIELFDRPTPLPCGINDWLEIFAKCFINAVPSSQREGFIQEVASLAGPELLDAEGGWTADHVRLRFLAVKP